MSIFLSLCNTSLLHVVSCQPLTKGICDSNLVESHLLVRDGRIIIREAYKSHILSCSPVKAFEIIITEGSGNLSCTVGTEVKEDNRIPILYGGNRLAIFNYHSGLYELVSFISVIGFLDSADSAGCRQTLAFSNSIICKLHAIPVIVSVHGIITPHNRSNPADTYLLHLCIQLLSKFLTACRRSITSVQEAMNIYFIKTVSLRQLQQTVEMGIVAVNAAVRKQT